jgi:hypothetical protein
MEEPKKDNQDSLASFSANEELLLADAEVGNIPLHQFQCTKCRCINTYLATSDRVNEILTSGRRMMHRINCINRGCYCHTGLGPIVVIKTREVDYGSVPF